MLHRSGSKRPFLVSADRALMHPEGRLEGTHLRLEAAEALAIASRRDAVREGRLVEVRQLPRRRAGSGVVVDKCGCHTVPASRGVGWRVCAGTRRPGLSRLGLRDAPPALHRDPQRAASALLSPAIYAPRLQVEFESLSEYMWGMRACCRALAAAGTTATAVLAAAVSDFYVKEKDLPEHKIQSRDSDGLDLRLSGVPKMLGALKLPAERASAAAGIALDDAPWCPRALVVSFKLETDPELLIPKARKSVGSYSVDAVIANLLEERYDECFLVSSADPARAPERIHRRPDEVIERPMAKAILQLSAKRA